MIIDIIVEILEDELEYQDDVKVKSDIEKILEFIWELRKEGLN